MRSKIKLILIPLLMVSINCIKFIMQIPVYEQSCFYQFLGNSQKYNIIIIPLNNPLYKLIIQQSRNGFINQIIDWQSKFQYQKKQVHKLSNYEGRYSFCLKNRQSTVLNVNIEFQTGIHLLQFELLPDKSDTQNLDRQISWIQTVKKQLYDVLGKVQRTKADNLNSSILLSTKMIIFAIIGLFSIVCVNFLFFREVKKTFKERKLI